MRMTVPRKSSSLLKRRLKIAEIVSLQGEIKVDELSLQLGVSGVTIRADLNYLENQGYLKRSFGGAIATTSLQPETVSISMAEQLSLTSQIEMARHCVNSINDRDTIFLGHGETCRKLIPLLSSLKNIRLIVNDIEHALLANQFINGEIILAGSDMLRPLLIMTGKGLEQVFQQFSITHSVLEVNHIDASGTLNIDLPLLAPALQCCLDTIPTNIALLTSVKSDVTRIVPIGQINQLEKLVLCHSTNKRYQQQLQDAEFTIQYTCNECVTWINQEKRQR